MQQQSDLLDIKIEQKHSGAYWCKSEGADPELPSTKCRIMILKSTDRRRKHEPINFSSMPRPQTREPALQAAQTKVNDWSVWIRSGNWKLVTTANQVTPSRLCCIEAPRVGPARMEGKVDRQYI